MNLRPGELGEFRDPTDRFTAWQGLAGRSSLRSGDDLKHDGKKQRTKGHGADRKKGGNHSVPSTHAVLPDVHVRSEPVRKAAGDTVRAGSGMVCLDPPEVIGNGEHKNRKE